MLCLVLGLRAELYNMATKDPTYAKLVMLKLEERKEVEASDELQESIKKLETHLSNQRMKAVESLIASNVSKRAGRGDPAGDH